MDFQTIQVKHLGQVTEIEINRPESKNALNQQVINDLFSVILCLEQAKVVILSGVNANFAAGADIHTMANLSAQEIAVFTEKVGQLQDAMKKSPAIWIAAIEGYCLGGGLELALATDIRLAHEQATFGFPEIKLSLLPGGGGTQRFLKLSGSAFANRYILTGELFSAQKAYEMGIISETSSDVQQLAANIAQQICQYDQTALRAIKQLISGIENNSLQSGLTLEREKFTSLFSIGNAKQGLQQFIDKKKVTK